MTVRPRLSVRAIRAIQANQVGIFAFFMFGSDILRIADISRLRREDKGLKGFQRGQIRAHVNEIAAFLESGPVLFPNAIILALSPEVDFVQTRGRVPEGTCEVGDAGTLTIPIYPDGQRAAWIVDGQQRSLALAQAKQDQLAVPVIGFVSNALETQREQFILVNKAKPLPTRLINELLPEVDMLLPRDLAARQLPSALCALLNDDPRSPFHGMIRRESNAKDKGGIVTDTALIEAMRLSIKSPLGALGQFKRNGEGTDSNAMYEAMLVFWCAVRDTFPKAWGKPSNESRLMHSAGIRAMGALMDPIMFRADGHSDRAGVVRERLRALAPYCKWTEGVWDGSGLAWDQVQSTAQHISMLSDYLVRLERDLARGTA
jgi:DGQHR domain-containing protein